MTSKQFPLVNKVSLFALLSCAIIAQSHAAVWVGNVSDDWGTAANWDPAAVPTSSDSVTVLDSASAFQAVINSGSYTVADMTILANASSGMLASLTIKSGASLHSLLNLDLGYYGGPELSELTVESGATVIVDALFLGNRPGPHQINFAGILTVNATAFSGATLFNYTTASTGIWTIAGDKTADINAWVGGGLITDRGIADGGAGWGTTHGINVVFDGSNTVVTNIPEPSSMVLLVFALFGMAVLRGPWAIRQSV